MVLKAGINTFATTGLLALLCCTQVTAEEPERDATSDTGGFDIELDGDFYEKRSYSDAFRIKGIELRKNVFFGEAKIAGKKGPGLVVEHGKLTWGFNHKGAEIQLRF